MPEQKALLLNASNLETFPVYPYAFIQVPAVARRAGIEVVCQDLLGIPPASWQPTIGALIEQHLPAMILITLRNTDTLTAQDYEPAGLKASGRSAYFPIERTRELIAAIRATSELKIAVGGFGFSLLPNDLMHYLRPDFGVVGGPDAFFAHFEAIRNGKLAKVANLLYFQGNQLIANPRLLYPPLADAEYTPQAIAALKEFYATFPSPGFQGAPVEIMRGCCHACIFCAEPHSAGRQVRYRDLSAVLKDIEILAEHGITQNYMISSELNPEGNAFILQLAERIQSFNAVQPEDRKITWYGANYLLNFSAGEFEQLQRSGFTGGWFDITALDDANAAAMRTPYRNQRLLSHLQTYAEFQKRRLELRRAQPASQPEALGQAGDGREDELIIWTMFLGNPATTIETIHNTLQTANQAGLPGFFDSCSLIEPIRVFDYQEPSAATLAATYSVNVDLEHTSYQQQQPSFAYPPALLQHFSEEEVSQLFRHLAETYLSKKYQRTRDWHSFVKQRTSAEAIARWLAEFAALRAAPEADHLGQGRVGSMVADLFAEAPPEGDSNLQESQAKALVDSLVSAGLAADPCFFESLGLPGTAEALDRMTPYELAVAVFSRWESAEQMTEQAQSVSPEWKRDLLQFCVQAILHRFNLQIKSKYRQLFIAAERREG